ncbi:CHASE2 domain-containing protein [Marinobacter sp.]|uniref:CHASE2 domain-containing protein n=1 Tax=Marinobacter sp. TaxID=50741 RepID=UPI00198D2121|nr:CHASE2 domain-containing protein [Marinobacter sp.]MBD3656662.1 CHASE2 domain-containing protein [Marinobacter sp.]
MTRYWLPFKNTPLSLGLPLLALLLLLQFTSLPQRIDFWLYDTLVTRYPTPVADNVAIIAIDEASLSELGRWPWPRGAHAGLVRQLDQAGTRTIVFDILFPEASEADSDLASAMAKHGRVVLPMHFSNADDPEPGTSRLPTWHLTQAAAALGHAHVELDADGLARGVDLVKARAGTLWPSLGRAAAEVNGTALPGAFGEAKPMFVRVPLAGRAGTLPVYSYADILRGRYPTDALRDKVVFVGATAAGFGDIMPTPFSSLATPMSGVEFHANSYSALSQNTLIRLLPGAITLLLAGALIALLSLVLPRLRPGHSMMLCLLLTLGLIALNMTLLLYVRLWLPITLALMIPLIACPLSSAQRLALTNHFLNRQMDELGQGPRTSLPAPERRHPPLILEHLKTLLQPEGWWLSRNGQVLDAHGLTAADQPPFPEAGRWIHLNNQSWIQLTRYDAIYSLGLSLPNDLSREVIQLYLRRLTLNPESGNPVDNAPREAISSRIDHVRRAINQMRSMHQFISRSFERMPDGIIVTDELGVIQFANGHIEEWFGEPMPSLSGMPLARLLEGHDPREIPPWHETVSETLTMNQSRTVDLRIRGMDFLIHFAPFALPDGDQNGIIANISNISELREQQRQHREAIDFISHDVRSPLVSQLALIEQMKRHPGEIDTPQLEQLGRLARRSYQLAEEFVQLARAEQLTETRFYECDFLAIVENARDSVSEQALEKGIHLVLQGSEELWLRGNAELLERAVINLLTNAVQYSPPGAFVTAQVFRAGHQACLTVTDEGSGIAEEELPYLFDRYRRQKSSELSGSRGAGLGLSFVHVVVEKHRGEIRVASRLGEGSAFTIKLPVANPLS